VVRPRLCDVVFEGPPSRVWEGIARHGRPVQYAHLPEPLATWDVWTPIAGPPVAVEAPSAGFALDWALLGALRARGVEIVSLTHAAGLSSTGDSELDALLPLDEPYHVPAGTALAVHRAHEEARRVVAIGTTVVRALESAGLPEGRVRAGRGLAQNRLSAEAPPRVVTAMLSGTHEPGTSHYALLEAFVEPAVLARATDEMSARGYLTHEFGDSVLVERRADALRSRVRVAA
jgi:S-adenosylmethionine:tRNA ribosyltransferase-isomerase